MKNRIKITRIYKLKVYPNFGKSEGMRYTYSRFLQYVNMFCGRLFFSNNKFFSTKGFGALGNQAQRKAQGIISALFASAKVTGNKINVPVLEYIGCPAKIEKSEDSSFDYWGSVENQFKKCGRIEFPIKSHRKLNEVLKSGWELNSNCELIKDKNNQFYVIVFVQKEVQKAEPNTRLLGCDVGYRNSVSRSDKYIGKNLNNVIAKQRKKKSQRQRQGLKTKSVKTQVKQVLDKEAKVAIARCKKLSSGLALENPKTLANLKSGKLHGWAMSYFANRCVILAKENRVFVWMVNPANTSITCSHCGHKDKRSRDGISFICTACGYVANADVNAARNIVAKGTVSLNKYLDDKKRG